MKKPETPPQPPREVVHVSDRTLRNLAGYHIKRASNVIQSDLARTLKPFGLRMLTYTALVLIIDNPGLRQSQLAAAMDVERPNLVVVIDTLEQRGLIDRVRVPTDRRAYALMPTGEGRALCAKAVAAVVAHEDRLLRGIDDTGLRAMIAALNRIEKSYLEG